MNKYYQEVTKYFNAKANEYDDVDNQIYWALSDQYFKEILKREIPTVIKDKKSLHILDAGAGTGRWTLFFRELFKRKYKLSGTLVDISSKMLEVAGQKVKKLSLDKDFTCQVGDIEQMKDLQDNSYDISLSFYNVLSFVENPSKAVREVSKKLKKGGAHISIVANKYHAYYFSILTNRLHELSMIQKKSKVRFNDLMPYIHCFTPEGLEELYKKNGFRKVKIIGGPNFIYPGMEETYVHGSTKSLQTKLSAQENFKKILDVELKNYSHTDIQGRANVLMAIAIK
jgi:ubiquinone/menaquinone biosynthesis C-methylase UbiE